MIKIFLLGRGRSGSSGATLTRHVIFKTLRTWLLTHAAEHKISPSVNSERLPDNMGIICELLQQQQKLESI